MTSLSDSHVSSETLVMVGAAIVEVGEKLCVSSNKNHDRKEVINIPTFIHQIK